jgi:hypothetical protein
MARKKCATEGFLSAVSVDRRKSIDCDMGRSILPMETTNRDVKINSRRGKTPSPTQYNHFHRRELACRSLGTSCRSLGTSCRSLGTSCRSLGTSCRCQGTSCRCQGTSCRCQGTSCRRLGTSCRRLGTSCRRLGTSCRRLGTSCRRLGTACRCLGTSCRHQGNTPLRVRDRRQCSSNDSNLGSEDNFLSSRHCNFLNTYYLLDQM